MGPVSKTAWKRDKLEEELEKGEWTLKKCKTGIKCWSVKETGEWNLHP